MKPSIVLVWDGGVFARATELRGELRTPFRAPHHTVSSKGLLTELAWAATGILVLDEVDEFRSDALGDLLRAWSMMTAYTRPVLVCGFRVKELTFRLRGVGHDEGSSAALTGELYPLAWLWRALEDAERRDREAEAGARLGGG